MKKLLIIGTKGMAGHLLFHYFHENKLFDVSGVARNSPNQDAIYNIDVTDTNALKSLIAEKKFNYIINCVGILNKDAEDNPAKAIWGNAYFPHFLEEITAATSTKVIHISTDCVFSGAGGGGYTESDFKNGQGYYAQSKALGELSNNKDLTIRTSIIGPELNVNGIGLLHWFLMQPSNAAISGYTKAYWSGITTLELSKVIEASILQNISGLIQVPSKQKINKYDLLLLFNDTFRDGHLGISKNDKYKVDKSLISIRTDFDYSVPDYTIMLKQLKDWIHDHEQLYTHYKVNQ